MHVFFISSIVKYASKVSLSTSNRFQNFRAPRIYLSLVLRVQVLDLYLIYFTLEYASYLLLSSLSLVSSNMHLRFHSQHPIGFSTSELHGFICLSTTCIGLGSGLVFDLLYIGICKLFVIVLPMPIFSILGWASMDLLDPSNA